MARVSREKQVADQVAKMLKDAIADLAVIASGRCLEQRCSIVSCTLFEAGQMLQEIDPMWIRIRAQDAAKQAAAAAATNQPPRKLDHVPTRLLTHAPAVPSKGLF